MDFLMPATAYAQAQGGAQPSLFEMLLLPIGFLLIMYFFIIRPQQKRAKEHSELITNLKSGDEVVTSGGIIGKVRSVADQFVTIEVANNTLIKVVKNNVSGLTKQQQPAAKQQPAKT